jgi:hypothetical protein
MGCFERYSMDARLAVNKNADADGSKRSRDIWPSR